MGDRAESRALFERALRITEKTVGPDHPSAATVLGNLGNLREDAGPGHPNVASQLGKLASVHVALARTDEARDEFARALQIFDAHDGIQDDELEVRFDAAKLMVETGADRTEALALAEAAARGFRERGPDAEQELAKVEAWLREQHSGRFR